MKVTSRSSLLGCALAVGAGALPYVAGAQAQAIAQAYVVTMSTASATGTVVLHEGLTIVRTDNAARLQLASADGSVLSRPVTLTAQGEIASSSQDGAVTCYNMAMNVLAHAGQPAGDPAEVYVRFANSIVGIPLTTRATQTRGNEREIALDGRSSGAVSSGYSSVDAGIVINATVAESGGDLHGATFEEVHYLGTPEHIVGRSTCVLQRTAEPAAATRV